MKHEEQIPLFPELPEPEIERTHNLWVSNAEWCDFVSFDPRMPEKHQLFIKRFTRSTLPIADHESKVMQFLDELHELANKFN